MTQKRVSKPKNGRGVGVGVLGVELGGLGFPAKTLTVQNAASKGADDFKPKGEKKNG